MWLNMEATQRVHGSKDSSRNTAGSTLEKILNIENKIMFLATLKEVSCEDE